MTGLGEREAQSEPKIIQVCLVHNFVGDDRINHTKTSHKTIDQVWNSLEGYLGRADLIEVLRLAGRQRVSKMELAGCLFPKPTQHFPVGHRQGKVSGGEHRESGAQRVGEVELKRATR